MAHFLERRDPWGNAMALYVLCGLIFFVPPGWWALRQLQLENDVEKWLPDSDHQLKVLHWAKDNFQLDERVFVTWDGSGLGDDRIGNFTRYVNGKRDSQGIKREGVKHVSRVIEPFEPLKVMLENGVDYPEAVRRLQGTILGAGPLRLQLTPRGQSRLVRAQALITQAVRKKFGVDLQIRPAQSDLATLLVPHANADPVDQTEAAASASSPSATEDPAENLFQHAVPVLVDAAGSIQESHAVEHDLQITWKGMQIGADATIELTEFLRTLTFTDRHAEESQPIVERCFFAVGSPTAIAVVLSETGVADKSATVDALRAAALAVGVPVEALHLGGSAVSATELNRQVKEAAWNRDVPWVNVHQRSIIALSALISVLMAVVLVRNVRLVAMVLFVSFYTTFVTMAAVPLTGGSMNMVLIVLPSLLIVVTLSGAIHIANYWKHAAAADAKTAVIHSVKTAALPCFLASFTTALGLISLYTSPLSPVREFGLYAAAGVMFSLVMVLYALPALMQIFPGQAPAEAELDHRWWRLLGKLLMVHSNLQCAAFMAVTVAASAGLYWFKTETKVIRYFSEQNRVVKDYWFIEQQLAGISPVELVIRFDEQSQKELPFLQRMEMVRDVEDQLRKHPEISGAISLADFRPVSPAAPEGGMARNLYIKRCRETQNRIRDGLPAARAFYAVPETARDLYQPKDALLNQAHDELWRITAQVSLMSEADYARVLKEIHQSTQQVLKREAGATHELTGTVPLFLRTQQAVLDSLINSFGLAFALILGIMVLLLKNFWAGVVSMIPNVVPITIVFGMISWTGQKIDIGTMITASVALGMAVDGTLHYLTWFRQLMEQGRTREEAIVEALEHCGPAIWQTSLVVSLGMLVLLPADLLLISRFGWLMASLTMVAMLGDIVLLPLLLAGPLGWFFVPQPTASVIQIHVATNESPDDGLISEEPGPQLSPFPAAAVAPLGDLKLPAS